MSAPTAIDWSVKVGDAISQSWGATNFNLAAAQANNTTTLGAAMVPPAPIAASTLNVLGGVTPSDAPNNVYGQMDFGNTYVLTLDWFEFSLAANYTWYLMENRTNAFSPNRMNIGNIAVPTVGVARTSTPFVFNASTGSNSGGLESPWLIFTPVGATGQPVFKRVQITKLGAPIAPASNPVGSML